MQTYIDSQRHLAAKAKETGATVLLSNHSEFDEAYKKNRMLAGRGDGPHPYEIGADWVQRYFVVTENCARATQLKLEQQVAEIALDIPCCAGRRLERHAEDRLHGPPVRRVRDAATDPEIDAPAFCFVIRCDVDRVVLLGPGRDRPVVPNTE